MVPELEKAQVTELHVRMDCNGCVQKIKKAMHGIDGVYDVYIDFPQQKLTVVGRADPEKIVKAIKKMKKIATICSHTEASEPAAGSSDQPPAAEPPAATGGGGGCPPAAPDAANPPPAEAPPAAPPSEPPKDTPPQEKAADADVKPSPEARDAAPSRDVEEIHMVHHYPHGHVYRENWSHYPHGQVPYYVSHSYSSSRPSPYVSGYGYMRSPAQDVRYNGAGAYSDGYYPNRGGGDGNQVTSIFSDENPNACRIA